MPQYPYNTQAFLLTTSGGQRSALNLQPGPNLVKASQGRLYRVVVTSGPGTAGTLAVNDCATTAAVSAANLVDSIGYASAVEGFEFLLEWPCLTGIVVTVPTGCTASVSYL